VISPDEVIMTADPALYFAKRAGRDCTASASQLAQAYIDDLQSLLAAIAEVGPQIVVAIARAMDPLDPAGDGPPEPHRCLRRGVGEETWEGRRASRSWSARLRSSMSRAEFFPRPARRR